MKSLRKLCVLFHGLTDVEFQTIKKRLTLRRFREKEVIMMCHSTVQSLFIIKRGVIKIGCMAQEKKFTLSYIKEGDFFGAIGLFTGGKSQVGAVCVSECEVFQLKQEDIEHFIFSIPIFNYNLLHFFAEQVFQGYTLIHGLAFRTVRQRIIYKLLELVDVFRGVQDGKTFINLSVTQLELAQSVGSARENVARILIDLKDKGIIDLMTKKIIIHNEKKLRSMLED